jgi:hypothetical protein
MGVYTTILQENLPPGGIYRGGIPVVRFSIGSPKGPEGLNRTSRVDPAIAQASARPKLLDSGLPFLQGIIYVSTQRTFAFDTPAG